MPLRTAATSDPGLEAAIDPAPPMIQRRLDPTSRRLRRNAQGQIVEGKWKKLLREDGHSVESITKLEAAAENQQFFERAYEQLKDVDSDLDNLGSLSDGQKKRRRTIAKDQIENLYGLILTRAEKELATTNALFDACIDEGVKVIKAHVASDKRKFPNGNAIKKDEGLKAHEKNFDLPPLIRAKRDARLTWSSDEEFVEDVFKIYAEGNRPIAQQLSAAESASLQAEKQAVTTQLAVWATVSATAHGVNANGTWGTSKDGATNDVDFRSLPKLNAAVWRELRRWWIAKDHSYVTPSETTDFSLKRGSRPRHRHPELALQLSRQRRVRAAAVITIGNPCGHRRDGVSGVARRGPGFMLSNMRRRAWVSVGGSHQLEHLKRDVAMPVRHGDVQRTRAIARLQADLYEPAQQAVELRRRQTLRRTVRVPCQERVCLGDDERLFPLGRPDPEPGTNRVEVASFRKPEYRVVVPRVLDAGRRGLMRRDRLHLGRNRDRRRSGAPGHRFQVPDQFLVGRRERRTLPLLELDGVDAPKPQGQFRAVHGHRQELAQVQGQAGLVSDIGRCRGEPGPQHDHAPGSPDVPLDVVVEVLAGPQQGVPPDGPAPCLERLGQEGGLGALLALVADEDLVQQRRPPARRSRGRHDSDSSKLIVSQGAGRRSADPRQPAGPWATWRRQLGGADSAARMVECRRALLRRAPQRRDCHSLAPPMRVYPSLRA
jgi:hypothetical protein